MFVYIPTGAEIVLACRDLCKANEAATEISKETGNKVTTVKLDLASLSSIREAVKELNARLPHIHILINNAGQFVKFLCACMSGSSKKDVLLFFQAL